MNPINWENIIEETFIRRKQEKLTQKEHALLADVGIPTMSSFEKGNLTLSLAKTFDILNVVGLIVKPNDESFKSFRSFKARENKFNETLRIQSRISDLKKELEELQILLKE